MCVCVLCVRACVRVCVCVCVCVCAVCVWRDCGWVKLSGFRGGGRWRIDTATDRITLFLLQVPENGFHAIGIIVATKEGKRIDKLYASGSSWRRRDDVVLKRGVAGKREGTGRGKKVSAIAHREGAPSLLSLQKRWRGRRRFDLGRP